MHPFFEKKWFTLLCAELLLLLFLLLPSSLVHAEASRLDRVLAAKELRVCIWPDYYGISYRNPKTRQLSGLDVEFAGDFAKSLGVGLRFVDSSFPQLADNLLKDRCDLTMHGVGITPQRLAVIEFSQPYMRSDIFAITTKSNAVIKSWSDLDQPGRVIAVQAGTVMVEVMQANSKHAKIVVVTPPATRQSEVESGRADAFMTDFPFSRRMLDTTDWARLITPPGSFHMTDYAAAFAPGDKSLQEKFNQLIQASKKNGRLKAIASKYKLESMMIVQ